MTAQSIEIRTRNCLDNGPSAGTLSRATALTIRPNNVMSIGAQGFREVSVLQEHPVHRPLCRATLLKQADRMNPHRLGPRAARNPR